ncbi:MAG TPA: NHL repeat-containing protein [Candidatus Eremiobacteraceae bacterium]
MRISAPVMLGLYVLTASLVACGGGGSAIQNPPGGVQSTPSPQVVATTVPFSRTNVPIALPGVQGFGETITLPSNNQSGSSNALSIFISPGLINGLPTLLSTARKPLAKHVVQPYDISPSGGTGLLFFGVQSPVAVTFSAIPPLVITVPAPNPSLNYYLAAFDPTNPAAGWQTVAQLPLVGSTLTFSGGSVSYSLSAGQLYGIAVYTVPLSSPAPSPSPTQAGSVYIVDLASNAVTEYDQEGNQINQAGSFPNLSTPCCITYDPVNAHLYVTSFTTGPSVNVYDRNGNQIAVPGTFPNNAQPVGITFDSHTGNLYLADVTGITEIYDPNGNQVGSLVVNQPSGITFDSDNDYFYVPSATLFAVNVYDEAGNLITTSGHFPDVADPIDIAFDSVNGLLYVANFGFNTITVYDKNGNEVTRAGSFQNVDCPAAIAFDRNDGLIYVTNTGIDKQSCGGFQFNFVTVYDQNGNQVATSGTWPNLSQAFGITAAP